MKPASFAQGENGVIYIGNGFQTVKRWDGSTITVETAGVIAPENEILITSSGTGPITGTYYAYQRFVDRLGNFSNISPVSISASGSVTNIVIAGGVTTITTSAAHGLTAPNLVTITGVVGVTGIEGSLEVGAVPTTTSFNIRDPDTNANIVASGTYVSGGTWRGIDGLVAASKLTLTFSNLDAAPSQVVRRQILRNKNGNTTTFYVDVDTTDLADVTLTSRKTDTQLDEGDAVTVADFVTEYGVPSDDLPLLTMSKARLLFTGEAAYTQGAVAVTFNSATVTGIGTNWSTALIGRYLYTGVATSPVLIDDVSVSAQTLTLDSVWTGPTAAYAEYGIRPDTDRKRLVNWSSSGLPEAVDVTDAFQANREGGIGEITAVLVLGSLVYLLEPDRINVFSFVNDPAPSNAGGDGAVFLQGYRGCVNQRCLVITENMAYILDYQGVYTFGGNSGEPLTVPIHDLFDRNGSYDYRINWEHQEYFHGVHDKGQEVIRFFVCCDARKYPHHCLCFDYRQQRWWMEEYAFPICSSCVGLISGQPVVFVGSTFGRVFTLSDGELDGTDPGIGTTSGTATSSGIQTLADSAAVFAAGLAGLTVEIVAGTGKGQRRIISAVSGTTITVTAPWTTALDTTSEYQIGGISYRWKSGVFRYAKVETSNVRGLELLGRPADTGTAEFNLFLNRSSTALKWGAGAVNQGVTTTRNDADAVLDLTNVDGYWKLRFDGLRQDNMDGQRFLEVELAGVKGADPIAFYELNLEGVVQ